MRSKLGPSFSRSPGPAARAGFCRLRWADVLLWTLLCLSCRAQSPLVNSEELAAGVVHHEISLRQGPWAIHVIEIDLPTAWGAGTRLRTARAAQGGLEKISAMAGGALAAINGDFFFHESPVRTAGLQVRRGRLLQEPQAHSAFAISAAGEPLIAVFHLDAGLVTAAGEVLPIHFFNHEPSAGELALYNRAAQSWKDSVHAAAGFYLQSLGGGSIANDTVRARVLQVRRRAWPLHLAAAEWLVAAGARRTGCIAPGDTVRLYCMLPPAKQKVQEAIGGGPRILRDGRVSIEYEREKLSRDFAAERHPRTAVGYTRDRRTLFLLTVDGRQPGYSVGMSLEELARFMGRRLATFTRAGANAYQALNLDGGGSTTMVVRRQVINHPSDQMGERLVANALLVVQGGAEEPGSSL